MRHRLARSIPVMSDERAVAVHYSYTMTMAYSQQERSYYDQLFAAVDSQDSGVLAGQDALPLLMSANLPQQTLGEIWALADPDNNGFLTKESWYKAARMVGWMQKGGKTNVEESLASQGMSKRGCADYSRTASHLSGPGAASRDPSSDW